MNNEIDLMVRPFIISIRFYVKVVAQIAGGKL